jgi:hypothetical protein
MSASRTTIKITLFFAIGFAVTGGFLLLAHV